MHRSGRRILEAPQEAIPSGGRIDDAKRRTRARITGDVDDCLPGRSERGSSDAVDETPRSGAGGQRHQQQGGVSVDGLIQEAAAGAKLIAQKPLPSE